MVSFGPSDDRLPARFAAVADYTGRPLRVLLEMSFDGTDRVKVDAVMVKRTDGQSVTPEDMTALQLAQVVRSVVEEATERGSGVFRRMEIIGPERTDGPSDEELRLLARMYWYEYVSWGKPRQAIMLGFHVPRSTANRWIRRARDRYGLPGPHSDEGD
jgi:hypothetical protein